MKSTFFILLLVLLPMFSMADKTKSEGKEVKKERREVKREKNLTMKKKFDNRSAEQKRKDRTILCLMAFAGLLIFKQMHE